jgi:hypothetical protein
MEFRPYARAQNSLKFAAMPLRKRKGYKPRRRGEEDTPATTPKSYTLPLPVFVQIREAASIYGSQGRAIQVGSEILARLKTPLPVERPDDQSLTRMTYKLSPRTIELIDELAHTSYHDPGEVLAASMKALNVKNLRW